MRTRKRATGEERDREQHHSVADVSHHRPEHQREEQRHHERGVERAGARELEEGDQRLERPREARVPHQHRRVGVAGGGRHVLDDDRRSEPGLHLGAQRRELASGYPAVGDEGSLRGADPPDSVEPFELPGDARAQVSEPLDMRHQQCPTLVFGGGDRLRQIGQTALDRVHRAVQREMLERVRERDVANLSPPEQGPHGRAIGVGEHDQTADGARLDARGQERELMAELLAQLPAERLYDQFVLGVEDQCDGAQPKMAEILVVELGELGNQRQQPPQRLEVAGKYETLVTERIQAPSQLVGRGREPIELILERVEVKRVLDPLRLGRTGCVELREQPVRLRREGTEVVAARRAQLLAAQSFDPVRSPRVGDLHATETLKLAHRALDLGAGAEDLGLCHRNEHALRPHLQQQLGELGDQLVALGGRTPAELVRPGTAVGTDRGGLGLRLGNQSVGAPAARLLAGLPRVREQTIGLRTRGGQCILGHVTRAVALLERALEPLDGRQRIQ